MSCHVPQGFQEAMERQLLDRPFLDDGLHRLVQSRSCEKCGKTTLVMHDILHADGDPDHLCDDCCPAELKRKAVPQDVVDILTKE